MSKTYVVADIHGRYDLLLKALELVYADAPEGGTFICLGDFIDRGPHSADVVDTLMAGPREENWNWVILQGNHEDIMLQALANPHLLRWWKGNGGGATLKSYGSSGGNNPHYTTAKVPRSRVKWIENLPDVYEDEHRIYVHAGIPSQHPVEKVSKQTRQWMLYREDQECLYSDATYFDGNDPHCSGKHVVHGHHQGENHPLLKPHRTNLDGWAWYTGRLHIGVFDDNVAGGPVKILTVEGEPRE